MIIVLMNFARSIIPPVQNKKPAEWLQKLVSDADGNALLFLVHDDADNLTALTFGFGERMMLRYKLVSIVAADSHSLLYLDINTHNTDSAPVVPLYDNILLLIQEQYLPLKFIFRKMTRSFKGLMPTFFSVHNGR